ncbi:MAG TPA: DNA recombination protein RmuC, partial [Pseudomonas sp.]|nr:DNA recombination protein RmuC [Pseudomonas sp.]
MSLDPLHLLIGLAVGLIALAGLCLYLQRRLVTGEAEQALLEERLRQAISAQQGLT